MCKSWVFQGGGFVFLFEILPQLNQLQNTVHFSSKSHFAPNLKITFLTRPTQKGNQAHLMWIEETAEVIPWLLGSPLSKETP